MIVGIGYKMRVGKDTAAQALCRELGFKQVAFADKLKQLALLVNPVVSPSPAMNVRAGAGRLLWVVNHLGWERAKDEFPEVRTILENLGAGAREVFGEDFWIEQAMASTAGNLVISDVRYRNEFDLVRKSGGKLIKIRREVIGVSSVHPTQTQLDAVPDEEWDAVIDNRTDLASYEREVVDTVRAWMPKEKVDAPSLFDPDGSS